MTISFPGVASPIKHVTAKLLQLHYDYAEKTVQSILLNIFWGNKIINFKNQKD